MNTFFIQTFGCQMNEYDSERIAYILEKKGLTPGCSINESDLVILNTCCVREKPEQKVRSLIGKLKKNSSLLKIGVMGCFAQQMGEKLLRNSFVDFVLGTDCADELPAVLDLIERGGRISKTEFKEKQPALFNHKLSCTAQITIMKGCNNFCSYCIVPYVRGREMSRPPQDILREAESLAEQGVKEITLLGQNVNSYQYGFSKLLERTACIKGLERLRFVTSHPKDFSEDLIRVMAERGNICPIVHLPLQSGSDRILKAMNRGYSSGEYIEKTQIARQIMPKLRFSSDFIVGFPGESEADFRETLNAMEIVEFESSFVFCYSPRPKTKAEGLKDDVPRLEKSERLAALIALQDKITKLRYKQLLGSTAAVLLEEVSGVQYTGRNEYNRVVNFSSDRELNLGDIVEVKITDVLRNTLKGKADSHVL